MSIAFSDNYGGYAGFQIRVMRSGKRKSAFVKYRGKAKNVWRTAAAREAKRIEAEMLAELGPKAEQPRRKSRGKNRGMWESFDHNTVGPTRVVCCMIYKNGKRRRVARSIDLHGKEKAYELVRQIRDKHESEERHED